MSEHTFTVFEIYFRHKKDGTLEIIDAPRNVDIYGEPVKGRRLSIWDSLDDERFIREGRKHGDFSCWHGRHFPVDPIDPFGLYYGQVLVHYAVTGYFEVEYDADFYLLCARPIIKRIIKPRVLMRLPSDTCYILGKDAFDIKEAIEFTAYGSLGVVR